MFGWGNREKHLDESSTGAWLKTPMARLLIVQPEPSFHTLFRIVLAQAGYVAIEAANSYEGQPAADTAGLADSRIGRRYLVVYGQGPPPGLQRGGKKVSSAQ